MNIWLVTTEFPPITGGIAPYALYSAEMFAAKGDRITIFFADATITSTEIVELGPGARLVRFHQRDLFDAAVIDSPVHSTAAASFRASVILEEAVRTWGAPDVVEFQDYGGLAYFTLQKKHCLWPGLSDLPVVLTAHRPLRHCLVTDEDSPYRLPHFFIGEMERWCYRAADAVLYPAEFIRDRLRAPDMNFVPRAAYVVRNPTRDEGESPFETALARLGARGDAAGAKPGSEGGPVGPLAQARKPVAPDLLRHLAGTAELPLGWRPATPLEPDHLVFMGKMQVQKGIRDLLEMMDRYWHEGGGLQLRVLGRDAHYASANMSMRAHLEGRYRRWLAEGRLRIEGTYRRADVPAFVGEGRIVAMPFREECMPYAVIEAIRAGGVPLAAPGGGLMELVEPGLRETLIYDPSDYASFHERLRALTGMGRERRVELNVRLRAWVDRISEFDTVHAAKTSALSEVIEAARAKVVLNASVRAPGGEAEATGTSRGVDAIAAGAGQPSQSAGVVIDMSLSPGARGEATLTADTTSETAVPAWGTGGACASGGAPIAVRAASGESRGAEVSASAQPDVARSASSTREMTVSASGQRAAFPFTTDIPASPIPPLEPAAVAGRISVVVPFHDMQDYADEAIASVLATGHTDLEIVLVDDGSRSDAAAEYLRRYEHRISMDPRLKLVRKANGGLASARNAGADAATGEFVMFLDADDRIHPRFLEVSLAILRRYDNVGFVGAWLRQFEGGQGSWVTWNPEPPYFFYHSTQHCTFLVRRDAWAAHGRNDPRMRYGMEDYESIVRMLSAGVRGVAYPDFHFFYRVRADSMMRGFNPHNMAYLYRQVWERNPQIFEMAAADLMGLTAENGHGAFAGDPTRATESAERLFGGARLAPSTLTERVKAGDFEGALRDARSLAVASAADPEAQLALAKVSMALMCAPEDCARSLDIAVGRSQEPFWPLLHRAEYLATLGAADPAGQDVRAGLALWDEAGPAVAWHAAQLLADGLPDAGRALALPLLETGGTADTALAVLGLRRMMLAGARSRDEALSAEREAAARGEDVWARGGRLAAGMALAELGDTAGARARLEVVPDSPRAALSSVLALGRLAELALRLDRRRAAVALGEALERGLGRLDRAAVAPWAAAVRQLETLSGALARRRTALEEALDLNRARAHTAAAERLTALLAEDPLHLAAAVNLAGIALHTDAAEREATRAMLIRAGRCPGALTNAWYVTHMLDFALRAGDAAQALALLEALCGEAGIDPTSGGIHGVLSAAAGRGQHRLAMRCIDLVLERSSDWNGLATLRAECGIALGTGLVRAENDLRTVVRNLGRGEQRFWTLHRLHRLYSRIGDAAAGAQARRDMLAEGVMDDTALDVLLEEAGEPHAGTSAQRPLKVATG